MQGKCKTTIWILNVCGSQVYMNKHQGQLEACVQFNITLKRSQPRVSQIMHSLFTGTNTPASQKWMFPICSLVFYYLNEYYYYYSRRTQGTVLSKKPKTEYMFTWLVQHKHRATGVFRTTLLQQASPLLITVSLSNTVKLKSSQLTPQLL